MLLSAEASDETFAVLRNNSSETQHRGKQAVVQNIVNYAKSYQEIKQDLHDFVANDKHVVALVTTSASRNGKTYKSQETFVFHVNDQAKITEAWAITDTEQLKASLEG